MDYDNAAPDQNAASPEDQLFNTQSTGESVTLAIQEDTITRKQAFLLTLEGQPFTDYVIWITGCGDLPPVEVPIIIDGIHGVVKGSPTAGGYMISQSRTVADDVPQTSGSGSADHYAMLRTDGNGRIVVGFLPDQKTRERSYAIRADRYSADGPSGISDEVNILITPGHVTIRTSGTSHFYIGEQVSITGTNTDSDEIFLFLTGPNLPPKGGDLRDPYRPVRDGDPTSFIRRNVHTDDTWSFLWDITHVGLDAGTYTIYAASTPNSLESLNDTVHADISITYNTAAVNASASQHTVAKGDSLTIFGTATGKPAPGVTLWLFGVNHYRRLTTPVGSDNRFRFEISSTETKGMAAGQFFVIIQHPMANQQFDVIEVVQTPGNDVWIMTLARANSGGNIFIPSAEAFKVTGSQRLQGSDAAEALTRLLDLQLIDDTYTKLTFLVEEPWIRIDTVGDKDIGELFTITGTTNLAVDNELIVEVVSSSFQPTDKTISGEFTGASGVVKVINGSAGYNTWSFEVDASKLIPDEYIVRAESIETDTTATTTFNLIGETIPDPPDPSTHITLSPGWNFVSTPKRLAEGNDTAGIFAGIDTAGRSIFQYNAASGSWETMNPASPFRPLDAVWIYANNTSSIALDFDSGAVQVPPSKQLYEGWNAIGFSGTLPATARDTLITVAPKWGQVLGWHAGTQSYNRAIIRGGSGAYSDTREMLPMQGYWVAMTEEGVVYALS